MKYTAKGVATSDEAHRIILFDGRFDTAFRITKFDVTPPQPVGTYELQGKLTTTEDYSGTTWNWGDNREIGWVVWGVPSNNQVNYNSWVDPDNLVVEDLYIQIYSTSGSSLEFNYMIEMEKVDISDSKGALTMVRNRSQA